MAKRSLPLSRVYRLIEPGPVVMVTTAGKQGTNIMRVCSVHCGSPGSMKTSRYMMRFALAEQVLDPNVLTLGFARRFAEYKRLDLLLHDPERLARANANPVHALGCGIEPTFIKSLERSRRKIHAFIAAIVSTPAA
jgi:hypothetical protein